jgi:hypothetical protein
VTNSVNQHTSNLLVEDSTMLSQDNVNYNKLNSSSITAQVNQLKQIFSNNNAAETFSKSFHLLFVLIKESTILIWLLLCWCIVALSWSGDRANQMYRGVLGWWKALQTANQYSSKVDLATETVQNSIQNIVAKAKKQLGLLERQ